MRAAGGDDRDELVLADQLARGFDLVQYVTDGHQDVGKRPRADGIGRPDVRAQLVTADGELILFRYDLALIRSSEPFLAALAAGEATEFEDQYMRIAPQFEVGRGRYAWLAESMFLGRGRLTGPRSIAYELYRVL